MGAGDGVHLPDRISAHVGAVANVGWDRWTPVNAAAIGAHLVGSVGQVVGNKGRIAGQEGVASMADDETMEEQACALPPAPGRALPDGPGASRRRPRRPLRPRGALPSPSGWSGGRAAPAT